jgi:hypothetical protein
VLGALVVTGPLSVAAVLTRIHQPGTSLLVARASLSRTLRRLWAAGLGGEGAQPSTSGVLSSAEKHLREASFIQIHLS